MTALPDRYMAWARYRDFSTGARHLQLAFGEVAEYPRRPRVWRWVVGTAAFLLPLAVLMAAGWR